MNFNDWEFLHADFDILDQLLLVFKIVDEFEFVVDHFTAFKADTENGFTFTVYNSRKLLFKLQLGKGFLISVNFNFGCFFRRIYRCHDEK